MILAFVNNWSELNGLGVLMEAESNREDTSRVAGFFVIFAVRPPLEETEKRRDPVTYL
jgi:hypothetical protein